jgi:2-polyprenyl-3-methyl-5-hydroxy-6-metoxy-1,4-benzoquinol methylase
MTATLTTDRQPDGAQAAIVAVCPVCQAAEAGFRLCRSVDSALDTVPDGLDRGLRVQVRIEQCRTCGLLRTVAVSDGRSPDELYTAASVCFEASASKVRLAGTRPASSCDELSLLRVQPPARLLDVGCGAGQFLFRAQLRGYRVTGIDLDSRAVAFARAELGLDVRVGMLGELPSDERFAVIALLGVVEHLPDPTAVLSEAVRCLAPSGELLIGVPNVASLNRWMSRLSRHDWDMFLEPGHLYHYDIRTLRALGQRVGLELGRWATGTMTIRGKVPLLPTRLVQLERSIARAVASSVWLRAGYIGLLRLLDRVCAGDILFATFRVREY